MEFNERIARSYSNGVSIIYEVINDNIYIHSILSLIKRKGFANDALREFINEFKDHNIFLFANSDFGMDISILNEWYEKLGFVIHNCVDYIPYKISHAIINKEGD